MDNEWTIASILTWTRQYFGTKGIDNPRFDAEVLLSHVLGCDRMYLYVHFDQPLQPEELAAFRGLVKQRALRVPVAYILGSRGFMGADFKVTPDVLIPRPDTEILVERALQLAPPESLILDIGTGSGAIIISLLRGLPATRGVAVDISPAALAVAAENALQLGVNDRLELIESDLFAALAGRRFALIVSNPPYITAADMQDLQPEVRREPQQALAGGTDGLDFYRRITAAARQQLEPDGLLLFEVGAGEAAAVAELGIAQGFDCLETVKDYGGIDRVVVLQDRSDG